MGGGIGPGRREKSSAHVNIKQKSRYLLTTLLSSETNYRHYFGPGGVTIYKSGNEQEKKKCLLSPEAAISLLQACVDKKKGGGGEDSRFKN